MFSSIASAYWSESLLDSSKCDPLRTNPCRLTALQAHMAHYSSCFVTGRVIKNRIILSDFVSVAEAIRLRCTVAYSSSPLYTQCMFVSTLGKCSKLLYSNRTD